MYRFIGVILAIILLLPPAIQVDATVSEYELLILCPTEFKNSLVPLVEHKESHGVSTKLVTLREIYSGVYFPVKGRDKPEEIKYFIKDAVENWGVQYVLLVGGKIGQLPLWYFPVRYVYMGNSWEPCYISDLYYADLYNSDGSFSSWDSDGDGVYGEWWYGGAPEDKYVDLYPDVAIGRLPCRSKWEVKIVVDKIITYESSTFGSSWFNRMVVVAGDTYPEIDNPMWKGYEGEWYGDRALENMSGFTPIRLYASDGTFTSKKDVIREINKGCGFLYLVGHGSPKTWGNHPPNNHSFIRGLTVKDVPLLRNKDMYPVCAISGCHNCQFDVSLLKLIDYVSVYRGEAIAECLGWRLTRRIDGGSIATFGCTALGHTKEDKAAFAGGINELEVQLFRQYGYYGVQHVGDLLKNAVTWYLDTYPVSWDTTNTTLLKDAWVDTQVVESYILLGDPSLLIGGYPHRG
ncbi:MAG TPA: hypothetical protein ENG62_01580 [Thermoplasmatales archaeon]|nr:hypothetical protein [Thermoplasmatales archaeon]